MAAKFVAEEGSDITLILDPEHSEWTIGRDPDESLLVIEDSSVSRKHCLCQKTPEGIVVTNLSSSTPLFINDQQVDNVFLLHDGDKIKIGNVYFRFYDEAQEKIIETAPKEESETNTNYDTILQDEEPSTTTNIDFSFIEEGRWLLKVMSGPNVGAEFSLAENQSYLVGTDNESCNIVFHDLSVSKQHAKLSVDEEEDIYIEDLKSRNGVLVNGHSIQEKTTVPLNTLVTLGTTSFLIFDREKPSETIMSTPTIIESKEEGQIEETRPEERIQLLFGVPMKKVVLFSVIFVGIIAGIASITLFTSKEAVIEKINYHQIIDNAIKDFPAIQYSFNKASGKLLLLGHVLNTDQKEQLMYSLAKLTFISKIDDSTVIDENVWQEMNQILSRNPNWRGIGMQSYTPGKFILKGYLKTSKEAANLNDYVHLNFSYLNRLKNNVVVEEDLKERAANLLFSQSLNNIGLEINDGVVTLSGYIDYEKNDSLQTVLEQIKNLSGVRHVKNFVVSVSPEAAIINLSQDYTVTGLSQHKNDFSVIINGKFYNKVDNNLDGMKITSIKANTILLEDQNGFKYRIDY